MSINSSSLEEAGRQKFKVITGYKQLIWEQLEIHEGRKEKRHSLAEEHWSNMYESLSLTSGAKKRGREKGRSENGREQTKRPDLK